MQGEITHALVFRSLEKVRISVSGIVLCCLQSSWVMFYHMGRKDFTVWPFLIDRGEKQRYKTASDDKTYGIAHFESDALICYFMNVYKSDNPFLRHGNQHTFFKLCNAHHFKHYQMCCHEKRNHLKNGSYFWRLDFLDVCALKKHSIFYFQGVSINQSQFKFAC